MARRKDCGLGLERARGGVEQAEGEKLVVAGVTGEGVASESESESELEHDEDDRHRFRGVLYASVVLSTPAVTRVASISPRRVSKSSSRFEDSLAIAQGR